MLVTLLKNSAYFKKGDQLKLVETIENEEGDNITWYMLETLKLVDKTKEKYQELVTQDYFKKVVSVDMDQLDNRLYYKKDNVYHLVSFIKQEDNTHWLRVWDQKEKHLIINEDIQDLKEYQGLDFIISTLIFEKEEAGLL